MRQFAKGLAIVTLLAMTAAAPLASAGESTSANLPVDPNYSRERWTDAPMSYPRLKAAMNIQSSRSSPGRRGNALMRKGLKAEIKGDNEKACEYYTRARQAFSDAHSSAGMNDSEQRMAQTCEAQSG